MTACNIVHKTVIEKLRALVEDGTVNIPFISESEDDRLLRALFFNYRDCRGVRLTNFGREILTTIFKSYSFPLPLGFHISSSLIVWLERESHVPYFLSTSTIIVFDSTFAIRLKLAGADLSLLMAAS